MIVDFALYVEGKRAQDDLDLTGAVGRAHDLGDAFVWIGLHEPDDAQFDHIGDTFDLHPLAVEDAVHAHQRAKLERYGASLFVVLKTARYRDAQEQVDIGEIMVFLGDDFVVTVRHGDWTGLARVREDLEANPEKLRLGPAAVLHGVADQVVDDYEHVLAGLEFDVEEIEGDVFAPGRQNHAERIYRLKRQVQSFRRAVFPLATALEPLATGSASHVEGELPEYFRDVADHVKRASARVATLDELLNSALNANLTQVSIRQNEDMRRISAWAAIAAVPTAIAGIYGMNFEHMPELDWRFGYPIVVFAMVALCVGLYRAFKRAGWL